MRDALRRLGYRMFDRRSTVQNAGRISPGCALGLFLATSLTGGCSAMLGEDSKPDSQRIYEALGAAAVPLRECVAAREPEPGGESIGSALVEAQLGGPLEERSLRMLGHDVAEGVNAPAERAVAQILALREHQVPMPDLEHEPDLHFGAQAYLLRRRIEADLFVARLPTVKCRVSAELQHSIEEADAYEMFVELLTAVYPLFTCMGKGTPMPLDGSATQAERIVQAGQLPLLREIARRYDSDSLVPTVADAPEGAAGDAPRILESLVAYADPTVTTDAYPLRVRRMMALAELSQLSAAVSHPQCSVPENLPQWMDVAKHDYP